VNCWAFRKVRPPPNARRSCGQHRDQKHWGTRLFRINRKENRKFWTSDKLAPHQGATRDSGLKEGAMGTVEESSLQNGSNHRRTSLADMSVRNRWLLGHLARTALRREQCDMF
jgi:hypothetical protein